MTVDMYNFLKDKLCKVLEWIIYLGLLIGALYLMKEVFYKYNSEDTSFKQIEEPITELPTLTICFSDYHDIGNEFGNFSMFYNDYFSNELYPIGFGNNFIKEYNENLTVEIMSTVYSGPCIRMHSIFQKSTTKNMRSDRRWVQIKDINPNVTELKVYFTSWPNSFGTIMTEWFDGEVLEIKIHSNVFTEISLKTEKYKFLKSLSKRKCREESFYECFGNWFLASTNLDGCTKKCMPITLPYDGFKDLENCATNEEKQCVLNVLLANMTNADICHKSCSIMQFSGKIIYEEDFDEGFAFTYKFAHPRVVTTYQEYLTYDILGTTYTYTLSTVYFWSKVAFFNFQI